MPAVRLAAFYFAVFGCMGVIVPFLSVWIEGRGFDKFELGIILAAPLAARVLAPPVWGQYADRTGVRRLMPVACFSATALLAALAGCSGLILTVTVAFVWGCAFHALLPLTDDLTNRVLDPDRYGQVRLWGSASFMIATVVAGPFIREHGSGWVIPLATGPLLIATWLSWMLPESRRARQPKTRPEPSPIRDPHVRRLLIGTALVQGSHAPYYGFSTVHWKAHGITEDLSGLLWSEGVIVEVALFACAPWILRRLRPRQLMNIGAWAAVIRWAGLASTTELPGLLALQWLHALSFGATFLGAVRWIAARCEGRSASVQALHSAGVALVQGVAMVVGGAIGKRFGLPVTFALSSVVALAGSLVLLTLERSRSPGLPFSPR